MSDIATRVRSFYQALPFNYFDSTVAAAAAVRANPIAATYPDLHQVLASGAVRSACEFGCGAGWLTNTLALHYGVSVTAIDLTERAVERAREVSHTLGVSDRVEFVVSDLFEVAPRTEFDLVVSMGVLHHTRDARAAFAHVARFVRDGGWIEIGLYHAPGRRPFLDHFASLVAEQGEEAAFAEYCRLDGPRRKDRTHARSWFRDQVLHPHETQHTLAEIVAWFEAAGIDLIGTSINRFQSWSDLDQVLALEDSFAQRSRTALYEERRFFPGFFTALGRRRASAHP